MKRPHIPLYIRCIVAARQLGPWADDLLVIMRNDRLSKATLLRILLDRLKQKLGCEELHLDHNPALALRKRTIRGGWDPLPNDPEYLIYRSKQDHHIKTNVRGDGAQRSDTSERVHQRRLAENRLRHAGKSKKRRVKIKSRGFPKQASRMQGPSRPWPTRPFPR